MAPKRRKVKQPWHRGTYQVRARAVVNAAKANPSTRCWRCGRTLAEHPRHKTGRKPYWTAGHVIDGQVNGALRPEASTCNFSDGATKGNRRRNPRPRRTELTW